MALELKLLTLCYGKEL